MKDNVEERALVVLVAEAEMFVRSFRAKYGGMADSDVPAHISINIPFVPALNSDSELDEALSDLFSGMAAFQFTLTEVRRFPAAFYLAPEPEERFRMLITAVMDRFPESPPYEGKFDDVVPHLTVAYLEDAQEINDIGEALSAAAEGVLPISGKVTRVLLIEKVDGKWRERMSFELAA
jgi:2'-5' RNA ligase